MIFVIAIVISGLMAWLGIRKGVYAMAATAFNLLMAIYVSLLTIPLVLNTSPGLETSGYYAALCLLVLITACFLLLQGICYYFFLRGADIAFPDLFDKVGGGLLGFVTGYVLAGILCLAVCMMPFSHLDFVQGFFPSDRLEGFCTRTTARVCHVMSAWSLQYIPDKPEETIEYLLALGRQDTAQPVDLQIKPQTPPQSKPVPESKPAPGTPPTAPKETPKDALDI
jgi:hypothetical protein